MIGYGARRLALAIPILLGVSIVVFLTIKIVPGDPVAVLLGPGATDLARAELTARLGLDQPWPMQYISWLGHALVGDFGRSTAKQTAVGPLVVAAFANTAVLAGAAALIAVVLGLGAGLVGALKPRGIAGRITDGFSLVAVSVPQYSIGLVLIIVFAATLHLLPSGGMTAAIGGGDAGDIAAHLILPAITAALVPAGVIARVFRGALLEVLSMDFIRSLRARGFSSTRVVLHAIHNAVPSVLAIAGIQIASLLGGVVFVEAVFAWPGIGQLVYQSITQRDLGVIQAGVLISALVFVLANLIVDLIAAAIDPRLRIAA